MARGRCAVLRSFVAASLAVSLVFGMLPAAFADGTGDYPYPVEDVLTRREAAQKAHYEKLSETSEGGTDAADGEVSVQVIDAPYYYTYTPSHKQERDYWCGPATVQVIDDYWGSYASQLTIATYMGTDEDGTTFSLVDDAIRKYTGLTNYYYYPNLTEGGFSGKVEHSLYVHHYPLATDVRIYASVWPNYNYDHRGHIIPIEGFTWVYDTIRINDVYNEADYYSSGGSTYGHKTYSFDVIWNGVYNHFLRAVVSPG